jgi:2-polyprenyl-3-methyl-5-hydroxy-6-metoxy-1,4-benzoquinol methylase
MRQTRNDIDVWDRVWAGTATGDEQDREDLAREEASIRWQRLEARILAHFGSFDGLRLIELGAGRGTNAALAARHGVKVTTLDYAPRALELAQDFFDRNGVEADYVEANVLEVSRSPLAGQFDIAMSFGLAEHFSGADRRTVVKAHFDLLRPNGIAFISVPHAVNPPYRAYKLLAELTGRWGVGEEYPFTRGEFRKLCAELGLSQIEFFGDSLYSSFHFIGPAKVVRKLLKTQAARPAIQRESGTILDAYLSYALVLCATK